MPRGLAVRQDCNVIFVGDAHSSRRLSKFTLGSDEMNESANQDPVSTVQAKLHPPSDTKKSEETTVNKQSESSTIAFVLLLAILAVLIAALFISTVNCQKIKGNQFAVYDQIVNPKDKNKTSINNNLVLIVLNH